VPSFVRKELEDFWSCGRWEAGCIRRRCSSCGYDRLVAFSCKGRSGACPSCGARPMAEIAANLVDHILPAVPMRQWVISVAP
jgi:hypothetical protein